MTSHEENTPTKEKDKDKVEILDSETLI